EWCRYKADFQMNINVSSLQFEVPSFKFLLMDMLTDYRVNPANITLELTESGKVKDPVVLSKQFDFIRAQGVHIALDD
ncbi:EAL domain-containing protein, partial [Bittarella massiliensis]|nr:EAL domain-containing protein [Bittarella massiliensis (ex Durand et al. 2017)]